VPNIEVKVSEQIHNSLIDPTGVEIWGLEEDGRKQKKSTRCFVNE
jgi:hypothetical protein